MRAPRVLLAGLAAVAYAAQAELPPELLLLSRIKRHVRESLSHVPNYTCLETTERASRTGGDRPFRPRDSVRLEVAVVGDKELYAPPGARRFEEGHVSDFVTTGVIGDGMFALHARSIFVHDLAMFKYVGEEDLAGRRSVRYDYHLTALTSGYRVAANGREAVVGCRGSFWVDPQSLDLLRLDIHAEEIPPGLDTTAVVTRIDYASVRIGAADVVLPQTAELVMVRPNGAASRNVLEFTHCREYVSQSTISFGAPPAESVPNAPKWRPVSLPAGHLVPVKLDAAIDSAKSAVGDLLQATSTTDVKWKGRIVVPAGARLTGRIRSLKRYTNPDPYFEVGLEFTEIEFGDSRADFYAELQNVARVPGLEWLLDASRSETRDLPGMGRLRTSTTDQVRLRALPGVGNFFMRGSHFRLPEGMSMVWKTRLP